MLDLHVTTVTTRTIYDEDHDISPCHRFRDNRGLSFIQSHIYAIPLFGVEKCRKSALVLLV